MTYLSPDIYLYRSGDQHMTSLSIIIPVFNEAGNILNLADEINETFSGVNYDWEVIWVNDCSFDGTHFILSDLSKKCPRHSSIHLSKQSGQSAALLIGIHRSKHKLIATLDGDGQNSPQDLLELKKQLELHDLWLAQGVRVNRMDAGMRKISTKIANIVRNSILGIELNDVGCAVRVFHKDALIGFPAFKGWHRFLPVMVSFTSTEKVRELPVRHRPRISGYSKYGVMNRLWVGIYDIFGILWLKNRGLPLPQINTHE